MAKSSPDKKPATTLFPAIPGEGTIPPGWLRAARLIARLPPAIRHDLWKRLNFRERERLNLALSQTGKKTDLSVSRVRTSEPSRVPVGRWRLPFILSLFFGILSLGLIFWGAAQTGLDPARYLRQYPLNQEACLYLVLTPWILGWLSQSERRTLWAWPLETPARLIQVAVGFLLLSLFLLWLADINGVARQAARSLAPAYYWHLILAGTIGPLAEEVFFRHLLVYRVLRDWKISLPVSHALGALAFGLAHMAWQQQPVDALFLYASAGLVLSGLRELAGNLSLPFLVHAAANFNFLLAA